MPCSGVDLEFYAVFLRGYSSVGRAMALQAIEIEGMESDFLLETLVEENNEYYSSDECVVTPEIVRTSEPSKFIMWGNRLPHIFTVDKQRSKLVFNATVV